MHNSLFNNNHSTKLINHPSYYFTIYWYIVCCMIYTVVIFVALWVSCHMFNLSSSGLWRLSGWLLLGSDHWRRADCATHRWLHRHHSQKGNMPWPISFLKCYNSCEAGRLIFNFTYFWTHKTSLTLRKACTQVTDHIFTHKTWDWLSFGSF